MASFLQNILSACDKIEAIAAGTSEGAFLNSEIFPAAILHHLTVSGKAVNRLSEEIRKPHPDIHWRQIVAMRHKIVHAYFDLDLQILWDAATCDIPELHRQVFQILLTGFPDSRAH